MKTLLVDPEKAKHKLGWVSEITVQEMCKEKVLNALKEAKRQALVNQHGYKVQVSCE